MKTLLRSGLKSQLHWNSQCSYFSNGRMIFIWLQLFHQIIFTNCVIISSFILFILDSQNILVLKMGIVRLPMTSILYGHILSPLVIPNYNLFSDN